MDDDFRFKDNESLARDEETCHVMAVLCTEPAVRRTYERRLEAIEHERDRRAHRGG